MAAVIDTAKEIFSDAWRLYAKYANGPHGDPDIYWSNLVMDSEKIAGKWPCGLAHDLTKAVLEEHSRREKRKQEEKDG